MSIDNPYTAHVLSEALLRAKRADAAHQALVHRLRPAPAGRSILARLRRTDPRQS